MSGVNAQKIILITEEEEPSHGANADFVEDADSGEKREMEEEHELQGDLEIR